jgi:hypothetical protein
VASGARRHSQRSYTGSFARIWPFPLFIQWFHQKENDSFPFAADTPENSRVKNYFYPAFFFGKKPQKTANSHRKQKIMTFRERQEAHPGIPLPYFASGGEAWPDRP